MANNYATNVTIQYKTEHSDSPSNITILANEPLTLEHLPELLAENYKFLGWVHINQYGHESSLSERMIISTDWLIPIEGKPNEYSVNFTAKWMKNKKSEVGSDNIRGLVEIKNDVLYLTSDSLVAKVKDDIVYITYLVAEIKDDILFL